MKHQHTLQATYDAAKPPDKSIENNHIMDTILEDEIRGGEASPDECEYVEDSLSKLSSDTDFPQDVIINNKPCSTTRVPTLSPRVMLVRTPKSSRRTDVISEEFEPSNQDYNDPVLITELNEEFPFPSTPCEEFEESDSDDELYERESPSQAIASESVTSQYLTDIRSEEYWDTDLEDDDTEEEEEDRFVCHYKQVCEDLGVVPVSYFIRHMKDTDIKMRHHGLGPTAARAIALNLKDDVHVEKLSLDGNYIQAEGGMAVARMLEENDYLTEVSLADNKLGNEGAQYICKMLDINAGLRSLDLSGNDFDDSCVEYFAATIENSKYLKKLNLSRNKFGEVGGEKLGPAIGANDRLDSIDLSWNHVRKAGACAIAKGLKENVGLKVCRLAWNGFGPEGGIAIAEALATNQSLTEIDLSGNRLSLATAERIARIFKTNDSLRILRMGNNLITTAGAIALVSAINANENCGIEILDLNDVPVEYEFLRIVEDIKIKKTDFQVTHGPIIRSGNTSKDLGKRAIEPYRKKEPVIVLDGHIVVNDLRLVEILARYDPTGTFNVSSPDFITALDELAVPYDKQKLQEALDRMSKDQSGRIYLGDALQNKDNADLKHVTYPRENS